MISSDVTPDLDDLEEIARQTSIKPNELTRKVHGGHGLLYHPQENIVHAAMRVSRPEKAEKAEDPSARETAAPLGRASATATEAAIGVTSYTELIGAVRAQVAALGLRYQDFDDLAGFPAGLSGKVFGGAQVKRLGPEKMFDAMRAAGLRIRLEPDPEQLAKMQARIAENFNPRQANQARMNNDASPVSTHILRRAFKHLSRLGGKARMKKMTKAERSAHARHAANRRWIEVRKRKKRNRAKRQGEAHRAANAKTDTAAPIHSKP